MAQSMELRRMTWDLRSAALGLDMVRYVSEDDKQQKSNGQMLETGYEGQTFSSFIAGNKISFLISRKLRLRQRNQSWQMM